MAEFSGPFTNGQTDGGPWSVANWWQAFRILTGLTASDAGVTRAGNRLRVTSPSADQVTVATGHAILRGTVYENDAAKTLTATRPAVGTTGKRVVLRKDIANGGVRLVVKASADGTAALPALTDDADTLEISLASFQHTTAGAINALTDERTLLTLGGGAGMIVARGMDWIDSIAQRYVAAFNGTEIIASGASTADLLDQGWRASGVTAVNSDPSGAATGDFDSASDYGDGALQVGVGWLGSPRVIGARSILNALERLTGQRPNTITCWWQFAMATTNDYHDNGGVGIAREVDVGLGTGVGVWLTNGATNFEVWNGSAAVDTGVAKDTNIHEVQIVINVAAGTYTVVLDGNEVVGATAVPTDAWPMMMHAAQSVTGAINLLVCGVDYD